MVEETKIINQDSIEIAKNSRGVTYTIKAYGNSPEEISQKLDVLMKEAGRQSNNIKLSDELS